MNKKILALLTIFLLLVPTVAMAANTFTVNYNVQVVGFTVEITANQGGVPETAMNFVGKPGDSALKPSGTNSGVDQWGDIKNTGEVALNFNIKATPVADITLKVGSTQGMGDAVTVTDTAASPTGWANIAPNGVTPIYATADFALAAIGKPSTQVTIGTQ